MLVDRKGKPMPLSDAHLRALDKDLRLHEKALKALRDEQDQIAQVVAIHEAILALGRDQGILDLLGDIAGSAEVAREAARDCRAYAQGRGIRLPDGLEVGVEIQATHAAVWGTFRASIPPFQVVWESDTGFRSRPLEKRASDGKGHKWIADVFGSPARDAAHQAE
jgi:hypothetical protein